MLFFDTSALIKRYVREAYSDWVDDIMGEDPDWAGSSLLAAEAAIGVGRGKPLTVEMAKTDARLSRDLEFFDLIPTDAECLVRAIDIGRGFGVKMLDAIHLAATSAIPGEFSFVTFDARQREAAEDLDLNLLKPPV